MTGSDLSPVNLIIFIDQPLKNEEDVAPIVVDNVYICGFERSDVGYYWFYALEEGEYLVQGHQEEDYENGDLKVYCYEDALVDAAERSLEGLMELWFSLIEHTVIARSKIIMEE